MLNASQANKQKKRATTTKQQKKITKNHSPQNKIKKRKKNLLRLACTTSAVPEKGNMKGREGKRVIRGKK